MNTEPQQTCDAAVSRGVLNLPESEQRALLHDSDPRRRIWAAWGLGQRLEHAFVPELLTLVAAEPVAGVRRHLVVMLAGFGETDIVAAISRRDEDERVRATAAGYVAILAVGDEALYRVLQTNLADRSALVRAAAARNVAADAPIDIRALATALRESDIDVMRHLSLEVPTLEFLPDSDDTRRGELVPYQSDLFGS